MTDYYADLGGLPSQLHRTMDRARFTTAYAVIPQGVMRDIVTSALPFWQGMRAWVLARPLSGFAETFSHLIVELTKGGGAERPELDPRAEAVLFVVAGQAVLRLGSKEHDLRAGSYVYVPAGQEWAICNPHEEKCVFHWIRKAYQPVPGIAMPEAFVTHDQDVPQTEMPDCQGVWATSRFVDPEDMRHDMHVNIVTFQPGGVIPFSETHVMEHGIYILQGKAVYQLNTDWVEVEAGDYLWLRAFCPQACYAAGHVPFRYLLYKDVNRHPPLSLGGFNG